MKIVSVDPGLRNLGVVVVECEGPNYVKVLYADVLDVARQRMNDAEKTKAVYKHLGAISEAYGADVALVEDQNFGRQNTNGDNLLTQIAAGMRLLSMDAKELVYRPSYFKFSAFYALRNKDPTLKGRYKEESKVLAANLIKQYNVVGKTERIGTSDHLSDAFGLAMAVLLKSLGRERSEPLPVPQLPVLVPAP